MEAACREWVKACWTSWKELMSHRTSSVRYSAYYLPDEELVNRIESQHNVRETSSLGIVPNDSGSTHTGCFCLVKYTKRKSWSPVSLLNTPQCGRYKATAAVIRVKSGAFNLSWNDIRCKTVFGHIFIALNMNKILFHIQFSFNRFIYHSFQMR